MGTPHTSVEGILEGTASLSERLGRARIWLDENRRNDPQLSRELIDRLLPEAGATRDASGVAWLRFSLGWLAIDADDYEQGIQVLESARGTFQDLDDHEGLSRCLNALGATNLNLGVYDLALDYLRESMKEAEKANRHDLAGAANLNMAACLHELEEPREALLAIEHCFQAYPIAPHNLASAHIYAGLIYRSLGRLEEAERALLESIRTAGNALHDSLEAQQALAEVRMDAGRLDEATILVETGTRDCDLVGERLIGTQFRLTRARLATLRGHREDAIPDIEAAIQAARSIGARRVEADAEKALYQTWEACDEPRKALEAFVRHARLKDAIRSEQTSRRILGMHEERARAEARHYQSLYQQISAISEIGQRITANLDFDTTLETLFGAINALMDAPTLMIALVDEERAALDYRLVMVRGRREKPFSIPLQEESFGCWCANHRKEVIIGDLESEYAAYVSAYKELLFDGHAEKSLVFVPLLVGDKIVGVLSVQSHIPRAYDKRKVEAIRAIGAYIAIAVANATYFRQIQRLAMVDALTGLLNRRRLTERIEDAYLMARRYGNEAGIIMVDLDRFKEINDAHGHPAGDEVLRTIAGVFTETLRDCDAAGRFGGEEFVLLLPATGLEGTAALAERLRKAIEILDISLPEDGMLRTTASFGVSTIRSGDSSHEAVLRRADKALYRSKEAGRNRVSIAPEA